MVPSSGDGTFRLTWVARPRRRPDRAAEAVGHEPRQVAGVVDVRVGQDDVVDRGGFDRQGLPVAQPQVLEALEQAAVDQ